MTEWKRRGLTGGIMNIAKLFLTVIPIAALFCVLALAPGALAGNDEDGDTDHHAVDPEYLTAAIARADKMMSSLKRGDLETRHFQIATDVFTDEVLAELAGSLEGTYYAIDQVLDLPLAKTERKVRVYFFEHPAQHYRIMGRTRGAYLAPGLLAFYKGDSATQELLMVLVHETTHAFIDQFIEREAQLPVWLNEGFATYLGFSVIHAGTLQPGVFYTVHRQEFLRSTIRSRMPAAEAAKRVARRIKRGPLITLDELLAADKSIFYGINHRDHYELAWAFVHYLRNGAPDGKTKFPRLVAAFARGADPLPAFGEAYSQSPSELESAFHEYVTNVLAKPSRPPKEILGK